MAIAEKETKDLTEDISAEGGLTGKIVGIAIGLFVVAIIMPSALTTIAGANLTGVDPAIETVFVLLLPIIAVIGIVLMFLRNAD